MMLQSDHIVLRALEPLDIGVLFDWENDVRYWSLSTTLQPFSKHVLGKYLENATLDIYEAKQLRLVVDRKSDRKAIGLIDLFDFDPFHLRAGVGILIANEQDRGKGYAAEALRLLVEYSFSHLQFKQLYCGVGADNVASRVLFERSGFQLVGTKKAWIKTTQGWKDELMFQLINPNFELK